MRSPFRLVVRPKLLSTKHGRLHTAGVVSSVVNGMRRSKHAVKMIVHCVYSTCGMTPKSNKMRDNFFSQWRYSYFNFCRAVSVCLSMCLTFVDFVKMNKHIFKILFTIG